MKSLGSLAARLSHRAGDFVRPFHGRRRPQQRQPGERVGIEAGTDTRRRGGPQFHSRRCGNDAHQRVAGVGHHQPSRFRGGDRGRTAEACLGARAIMEPGSGTRKRASSASLRDRGNASAEFADVELTVSSDGDTDRTIEHRRLAHHSGGAVVRIFETAQLPGNASL